MSHKRHSVWDLPSRDKPADTVLTHYHNSRHCYSSDSPYVGMMQQQAICSSTSFGCSARTARNRLAALEEHSCPLHITYHWRCELKGSKSPSCTWIPAMGSSCSPQNPCSFSIPFFLATFPPSVTAWDQNQQSHINCSAVPHHGARACSKNKPPSKCLSSSDLTYWTQSSMMFHDLWKYVYTSL